MPLDSFQDLLSLLTVALSVLLFFKPISDALFSSWSLSLDSSQTRCGETFVGVPEGPCFVVNEVTIRAVRALFPAMDEQTFANVILECGSDIEQV